MNGILDNAVVGLALVVSAGYALSSLGPRSLRRHVLQGLSQATARAPEFLGLRRLSARLAAASGVKAKGTCGGCDDCGPAQAPAAEVSVPVSKIGRRVREGGDRR